MAKTIKTVGEAIKAYGGVRAMNEAFGLNVPEGSVFGRHSVAEWRQHGEIPRGAQLGMCLGLEARGYRISPKLFGVKRWAEIPGVV